MLQLYTGSGKGKTTAAAGLAVRAAGRGIPVLFAQVMKDGSSGEISVLRHLPDVTVLIMDTFLGFSFRMNEEERTAAAASIRRVLSGACAWAGGLPEPPDPEKAEVRGVLILDEALSAVRTGLIEEAELIRFTDRIPEELEVVMTGRGSFPLLEERAEYVSYIECRKHPYLKGTPARRGIEY